MHVTPAAFVNAQAPAALLREPYLLTVSRWAEGLAHHGAALRPGRTAGQLSLHLPGDHPLTLQPGKEPHEVLVSGHSVTRVTPHALYAASSVMEARLLPLDHHSLLTLTHPIQQIYTELTNRSHAVTASRPMFSADMQLSLYHLHSARDAHWLILEHRQNTVTMTNKWLDLSA